MANKYLMGFSKEGVIPNFDKRIISDTIKKMMIEVKIDSIQVLAVKSLHLDFDGQFRNVVSSDGSVLKYAP